MDMKLLAQGWAKIKSSDIPFSYTKFQVAPVNSQRPELFALSENPEKEKRG